MSSVATTILALAPVAQPQTALWRGVDRLIDRAPSLEDIRLHKLHLLALRRRRETGAPVPAELAAAARTASFAELAAPLLLQRVRTVVEGPILLLKGPEVAARYPGQALRPFGDLDLLVSDPVAAQRALIAAGFKPVGDERVYTGIHHLRPLHYPSFPLVLEIHARPKWLEGVPQPRVEEIFEAASPSAVGIDGIQAPSPEQHILLLATHAWAHAPLAQLLHLVDMAAMRVEASPDELDAAARRWRLGRLWSVTDATLDALFLGGPQPLPLRVWARNLRGVRGRTVLESHLERWFSPLSLLPLPGAVAAGLAAAGRDLRPAAGEDWSTKLLRTRYAIRNAFVRRVHHESELESVNERRRREGER